MATYWLTFRIKNDTDYPERHSALVDAVAELKIGQMWAESTSFFVFASEFNIDQVAARIGRAIEPHKDLALIGMPEFKDARYIGLATDDDSLFKLMPFTKYA